MPIRFVLRIGLILLIPVTVAALTFIFLYRAFFMPLEPKSKQGVIVDVQLGQSFTDITMMLTEQKVLRYSWTLRLLARLRKVDTKINAGEYELNPAMTPKQILAKLVSGEVVKRPILVKEGQSIWEIPAALKLAGIASVEEFTKALTDPALLRRAGVDAQSFEGYMYPETYYFSKHTPAEQIVLRMVEEGNKHWTPQFEARAEELRMNRNAIITLASIIEKETARPEERPMVSSVFHNRLSLGMKLQADPTVAYGIPNFNGKLTKDDLSRPSPYNTYTNFGLPPGPIANPSIDSIRAALNPQQTTYLFFVADGTGGHIFATTLAEHNQNVERFRRYEALDAAAVVK